VGAAAAEAAAEHPTAAADHGREYAAAPVI
jgi:hypothetical protein